jgi:hypothetical protein
VKPLWPIGAKRGKHVRQRPLPYLTAPIDRTVPYDPSTFEMTDSLQPKRTPRELRQKPPGW